MIRFLFAALIASPVLADSPYGCALTETTAIPAIEGEAGTFYRVLADLRLRHPLEDPVIAQLSALSQALAQGGTTLVYVAIPTKAQVMPKGLPPRAADYGFDAALSRQGFAETLARVQAAGLLAPDLMTALSATETPFFPTDFHWTAEGATAAAQAIAALVATQDLPRAEFTTVKGPVSEAFSTLRRTLQARCLQDLPHVAAPSQTTSKAGTEDIFATETAPQIVLVGTSFSDAPLANFAGALSQATGLDVRNYAVTGGNQFGAITSYLLSRDFAETRPSLLIWENPIYNNLAQYGPDAMAELIAAAGQGCTVPLVTTAQGATLTADLRGLVLTPLDTIRADLGVEGGRQADFRFTTASSITRTALIRRSDRVQASGVFFKPLSTLWHPDLQSLTVTFDQALGPLASLTLCHPGKDPT